MSGYLLGVIGMVLFCTILSMAIPQGKTTVLVHAIARLACVLTILAPIPNYLWGENKLFFGENSIEADANFISYYSELRIKEVENTLAERIQAKYGRSVSVVLYWEEVENAIKINAIAISGSFSAMEQAEIEKQIQEDYGVKTSFYGYL